MLQKLAIAFSFAVAAMPSLALADEACSAPLAIAGAHFEAKPVTDGVQWDAQWVLDIDAARDFCGGTIALAVPLPKGERLLPTPHVEAFLDGGQITALRIDRGALVERSIVASFFQPGAFESPSVLGVPASASDALQVVGTHGTSTRIELARSSAIDERFVKHLGSIAPRNVGSAAREEARRLVGVEDQRSALLYVRGQDLRALGGVRGRVVDSTAQSRTMTVAAFAAFSFVLGALVLAFRKLAGAAHVERADAVLAAEIDAVTKEAT